jgi:hypothetical protein
VIRAGRPIRDRSPNGSLAKSETCRHTDFGRHQPAGYVSAENFVFPNLLRSPGCAIGGRCTRGANSPRGSKRNFHSHHGSASWCAIELKRPVQLKHAFSHIDHPQPSRFSELVECATNAVIGNRKANGTIGSCEPDLHCGSRGFGLRVLFSVPPQIQLSQLATKVKSFTTLVSLRDVVANENGQVVILFSGPLADRRNDRVGRHRGG